jgi:hypothetical protein
MAFEFKSISERQQADYKADGRMRAFLTMKAAFKKRAKENGVTIQSLSKAIGRDKGQVSRILSGRSAGLTLDTLVLITSALGFRLSFDAVPVEEMKKRNWSVAPLWASTVPVHNAAGTPLYVAGASSANNANTFVSMQSISK